MKALGVILLLMETPFLPTEAKGKGASTLSDWPSRPPGKCWAHHTLKNFRIEALRLRQWRQQRQCSPCIFSLVLDLPKTLSTAVHSLATSAEPGTRLRRNQSVHASTFQNDACSSQGGIVGMSREDIAPGRD